MKNETPKNYVSLAVYGLIFIACGALLIILLLALRDYLINKHYSAIFQTLNPFIYGAVIAYLLDPLMQMYERKVFKKAKTNTRRLLALAASFVSALILISLIALMIFPQVGASVNQLAGKVADLFSPAEGAAITEPLIPSAQASDPQTSDTSTPSFLQDTDLDALFGDINTDDAWSGYDALMNTKLGVYIADASASVQNSISRFGINVDIEQSLRDIILSATARLTVFFGEYFQTIFNTTATFIFSTAKQVLNIIVGLIIAFYILADKERLFSQIKRLLYALLPTAFVNKTIQVTRTTHRIFGGFIMGKLLDSLIIGVLCFICMSIFKINYPMLISVIVGITNIIPFFGPFIGAIPSILFLSINDMGQGLWFAVFILILQQIDGNIIGPKIIGPSVGLSAFWVIFSIMVFSGLLGPVGMFIGVPVFAVIYTLLKDFSVARLAKKGLPATGEAVRAEPPERLAPSTPFDADSARRSLAGMVERLSNNIHSLIKKPRRRDGDAYDDYEDEDDN